MRRGASRPHGLGSLANPHLVADRHHPRSILRLPFLGNESVGIELADVNEERRPEPPPLRSTVLFRSSSPAVRPPCGTSLPHAAQRAPRQISKRVIIYW